MTRVRSWFAVGAVGLCLAACGGGGSGTKDGGAGTTGSAGATAGTTGSAGATGAAGADGGAAGTDGGVTVSDASVDTSSDVASGDGGACSVPSVDAGACNALTQAAPAITIGTGTGDMPVGTGGTFVPGTYFLTEMKVYTGSPVPSGIPFRQTFVLDGCTAQLVEGTNVFKTFTYAPVGTVPNWTMACTSKAGDSAVTISSYTATATTFSLYSTQYKFYGTYTKQP
jgi:hypothetical protein